MASRSEQPAPTPNSSVVVVTAIVATAAAGGTGSSEASNPATTATRAGRAIPGRLTATHLPQGREDAVTKSTTGKSGLLVCGVAELCSEHARAVISGCLANTRGR